MRVTLVIEDSPAGLAELVRILAAVSEDTRVQLPASETPRRLEDVPPAVALIDPAGWPRRRRNR